MKLAILATWMWNCEFFPSSSKVPVVPLFMHREGGIKLGSGFGFASVNGPDHHAHSFHGVEASSVVRPEDAILELVAIHATRVPDAIKIGLPTCIVPPATLMEVSTVSCSTIKHGQEQRVRQLVLRTWKLRFYTRPEETQNIQRWLGLDRVVLMGSFLFKIVVFPKSWN